MQATVPCSTDFNGDVLAPRLIAAGIAPGLRRLGQLLRPLLRFAPSGMAAMTPSLADADRVAERQLDNELFQGLIKP